LEADEDERLIADFKSGDMASFDLLVKKYQRRIYYLALRYVKNEADAQDVAQRAFVQAFQRVRSLRRDASFRTWVYKIAVNLSINALRDSQRRSRPPPLEIEPEAVSMTVAEDGANLRRALERLPPKQRMVVELRVFEDLSFKEVGRIVDSSEDSAKVNYHHALKRLRSIMQEGGQR
jgi:RNA polymerase sigma-70 factor (ECF subfamily)